MLFDEGAWRRLADLFRKDLYRLHSMPLEAQLSIHLQVSITLTMTCRVPTICAWGPIWCPERCEGAAECHACLQAGLSALKTPQSYSSASSKEDPLSTEVCHLP